MKYDNKKASRERERVSARNRACAQGATRSLCRRDMVQTIRKRHHTIQKKFQFQFSIRGRHFSFCRRLIAAHHHHRARHCQGHVSHYPRRHSCSGSQSGFGYCSALASTAVAAVLASAAVVVAVDSHHDNDDDDDVPHVRSATKTETPTAVVAVATAAAFVAAVAAVRHCYARANTPPANHRHYTAPGTSRPAPRTAHGDVRHRPSENTRRTSADERVWADDYYYRRCRRPCARHRRRTNGSAHGHGGRLLYTVRGPVRVMRAAAVRDHGCGHGRILGDGRVGGAVVAIAGRHRSGLAVGMGVSMCVVALVVVGMEEMVLGSGMNCCVVRWRWGWV